MAIKKKKSKLDLLSDKEIGALKGLLKKKAEKNPELLFPISDILFKEQLDFVNDDERFVVACCSRRSGKSISIAAKLILEAVKHDNRLNAYITLSKTSARTIIWDEIVKMIRNNNLDVKFNDHAMIATFWNGSKILIYGAKDSSEVEKMRGNKFNLVVLDEAQSFRPFIGSLINEIIIPALGDYQGKILMTGTPGPVPAGVFYDACHNKGDFKGWSFHHWTLKNNTKFPSFLDGTTTYDAYIAYEMGRQKISATNPAFRREFLGEWCKDDNSLVYNIPKDGLVDELPPNITEWKYLLAYDTGFNDDDAFSVIAYNMEHPTAYVVDAHALETPEGEAGRSFTDVALHIKALNDEYSFSRVVFDPTESGKKVAEEIRRRYGISMQAAEKTNKQAHIAFLNDDMRMGKFKLINRTTEELQYQWNNLTWEPQSDGTRKPGTKINNLKLDHLADCTLYGWREARHYLAKLPEEEPMEGTPAWEKKKKAQLKEQFRLEAIKKDKQRRREQKKKKHHSRY
jgi:hypothetical protein